MAGHVSTYASNENHCIQCKYSRAMFFFISAYPCPSHYQKGDKSRKFLIVLTASLGSPCVNFLLGCMHCVGASLYPQSVNSLAAFAQHSSLLFILRRYFGVGNNCYFGALQKDRRKRFCR
jgi:hypothetical protein